MGLKEKNLSINTFSINVSWEMGKVGNKRRKEEKKKKTAGVIEGKKDCEGRYRYSVYGYKIEKIEER